MGFLFNRFKKKEKKAREPDFDIISELDKYGIIYDDSDEALTYIDFEGNPKISIKKENGKYLYRDNTVTESYVFSLFKKEFKREKRLKECLEDENCQTFFEIKTIVDNLLKEMQWTSLMDLIGDNLTVSAVKDDEKIPLFGLNTLKKNGKIIIYPSDTEAFPKDAYRFILEKLYELNSKWFESSSYIPAYSEDFIELFKQVIISKSTINKLNKIPGIEAKMCTDTQMFIMFPNGAAIDYIFPTAASPKCKITAIEYNNHSGKINKNTYYKTVLNYLRLPENILEKPDLERKNA